MCWVVFAGVPAGRRVGGGGSSAAGKETAQQHTLAEIRFIQSILYKMFTWSKITHAEKKIFLYKLWSKKQNSCPEIFFQKERKLMCFEKKRNIVESQINVIHLCDLCECEHQFKIQRAWYKFQTFNSPIHNCCHGNSLKETHTHHHKGAEHLGI